MAAIDDLIAQVEDRALAERLRMEFDRINKWKKFGLVFENHLPELTPIYNAKIQKGSLVALRGEPLTNLWYIASVTGGKAHCLKRGENEWRSIAVEDLVTVRPFGEPVFPSLVSVECVQNGSDNAPWHTLIEADNYHALQLLQYLYIGQVDCIYIDPPYNTGDKSWKYNNDYVDENDTWRHSKWLSFMGRRLQLAEKLLAPNGVLIVTIDEHEVHNLGLLLKQTLESVREIQMVTIVSNTAGSMAPGRFSRAEEYAFFCFYGNAKPLPMKTDMLSESNPITQFWFPLYRSRGLDDRPSRRPNLVYPIAVDTDTLTISSVGRSLKERVDAGEVAGDLDKWKPERSEMIDGKPVVWPILDSGEMSRWQVGAESLLKLASEGFVRVRPSKNPSGPRPFTISYIKEGNRKKILSGEIAVAGREQGGAYILYSGSRTTIPKTVWKVPTHDARQYGTTMLRWLLGQTTFSYPKSPYATADALHTIIGDKKDALVVDFFAGSGTTLHSLLMLNSLDGGQRRCILITNNEVSDQDVKTLSKKGLRPGDYEWEKHGICRSITLPRCKYAILGKRNDGSELEKEYLTGRIIEREKPRNFQQISFTTFDNLNTVAKKKQLVALINGIPQSETKKETSFVVSAKHSASILFDESQADAWIGALEEQDHITDFYIVTTDTSTFDDIKARIDEMFGPMIVTDEEKRPLRDGFPANLEYFRLDFLDKNNVALGRQFREILPILWMRAGAIGRCPELQLDQSIPKMLLFETNSFAVLIDETRFADFQDKLKGKGNFTYAYLVTDSHEAFQEMALRLNVPNVVPLYRDYLENFAINKGDSESESIVI